MFERISPPLKWHGGKYYLATKIVSLMPPHTHYVEAFAGGLSVLLAKDPEGISEVINDRHNALVNFWRVIRSPQSFPEFQRILSLTPFSEEEWNNTIEINNLSWSNDDQPQEEMISRAVLFFIHCRQSLAGRMNSFAPLSKARTRRGMNEQASAWLSAVDGLASVHLRLMRVAILNRDALEVIRQQDGVHTLFYLDPPYLHETRTVENVYSHEMTFEQHRELLDSILQCKGKVMISGYSSDLYNQKIGDWTRHEFTLPNQAAGGKTKRKMTEVLWCNF